MIGCEQSVQAKEGGDMVELTWQWRYDQKGWLAEIEAPGKVTTRVTYTEPDAKTGKGETRTIEFDGEKRTFTWDLQGRLVSAKSSGGEIVLNHNKAGLPTELRSAGSPTIRYRHDVEDRLTETRIGDSAAIRYRYDYLGRLAAIVTPAGEITYSYDRGANRVIRRLPNGVQTIREYDDEGRLIALTHVDPKNFIIAKYAYAYRPDGLLEGISEHNQRSGEQICRYEYDIMQRLTGVKCMGKGRSYHYGYDSLGNLAESQTAGGQVFRFTSTPAGALATDSRGAIRTDERGHIRQLPDSPDPINYAFNGAGELSAAEAKGKKLTFEYNALGLLTSRTVDGRETRYLPDPFADAWHPLWQRDPEGKETVTVWEGAVPLMELQGKEVRFRLEDHLGSVRMEVDSSGKVAAWHDYTPYGILAGAEGGGELRPGFAGLFWDPTAKVYHAMARAYDPVTARFLQPDPRLRIPGASRQSHSLYSYTGGDPVNLVDRNGAEAVSINDHAIWWGAFLKDVQGHLLDAHRAKDILADYSASHLINARGTGVAAGITATLLDIAGGYIPGEGGNRGQAYASVAWSLATGLGFSGVRIGHELVIQSVPFLKEIGTVRSLASPLIKTMEGDYLGAAVDLIFVSNGPYEYIHKSLSSKAFNLRVSLELTSTTFQRADTYKGISTAMESVAYFGEFGKEIVSTAKAGFEPLISSSRSAGFISSPVGGVHLGGAGKASRIGSDADAVFAPKGMMGVSFVASSRPLTTEEYATWKSSKSQKNPATESITGDRWNQFGNGGGPGKPDGPGGGSGGSGPGGRGPGGPGGGKSGGSGFGAGPLFSMAAPSRVGGVHLGGAGKALEGLGQLKGIAVDEATGKLAFIASDEQKFAFPPLRLDDVVTIFRAVYNHGQSPSVTIDPNEENPNGPTMHVKHGPGTEETYIGWILFECDRIMKSYQLGEDNVTHQIVNSQVPGYAETVEEVFFGDSKQKGAKDENWERFWIVPAAVRRFDAVSTRLSLFEVPLKVNTQKMRLMVENKNGRRVNTLVDDESGKSSPGALAFKNWFSDHYNEIADEVRLTPPPDSGLNEPVAIFHELRRIALITAVAERLRDLGEPMPSWMRDYPVVPFSVAKTTPSLTVEKKKTDGPNLRIAHIYGGVNLAPADSDLHTYSDPENGGAKPVSREEIAFVNLSREETALLTSKIPELARVNAPIGTVHPVATPQGKKLSVVFLPGSNTLALAPNRQEVSDLVVPIGLGRSIGLTRYYHSFFDPAGAFGRGWTLNLPELLKTWVPIKRDCKRSEYRVVQHLVSPLGTVDIRFDQVEKVAPYGIEMPVAKEHPEITGIARGESKIIKAKTDLVLFRDGSEWHFDDEGRMVLAQAKGAATRYVRDGAGRVQQIVGYVGDSPVADILLVYDPQGRIVEATASQTENLRKQVPAEVLKLNFEYGEDGRLRKVLHPESKKPDAPKTDWSYTYEANHLVKIGGSDRAETSFGYDAQGHLLWKKEGDRKTQYTVTATPQGTTLRISTDEGIPQSEKWLYDERMRPLEADLGEGRTVRRRYGNDYEASETLSQDGKPILTRSISQDGRTETMVWTDGPTYEVRKDATGRPTTLSIDGVKAATISWEMDGTLAGLRAGDTEIHPRRHQNGWPNGVLISAPMIFGKTNEWIEEEWNVMGRPTKITDSSGFEYKMGYDDQGRLNRFGKMTKDGKLIGANLLYNDDGLITGIDSSWSKERREYGNDGILKGVEIQRQGKKSASTFDVNGRPVSHSAFDGGAMTWRYDSDDAGAALRAIGLPNGKEIDYASNESGKTRSMHASLGSAVVQVVSNEEGRVTVLTWSRKTS